MGYLGDGRLGLNFGRFGRIDPKYFGRWEIDLVREQRNGRNRKIHGSTYLGAGRLAVIKVGDGRLRPPIGGLPNARNGLVNFKLLTNLEKCGAFSTSCLACILSVFRSILAMK